MSKTKRKGTFAFKGSGGSGALHFKCKLDKQKFAKCRSPKSYKHLKKGRHVFRVEAVDSKGKADPRPAKKAFRI